MTARFHFILLRMRRTATIIFAVALFGATRSAPAGDPPDTLDYTIRIGENRLGSMRWLTRTVGGGTEGTARTTLRVDRAGSSLDLTQELTWKEDPEGHLERMSSVSTGMGPAAWRDSVDRIAQGTMWRRTRTRGGEPRTDSLPGGSLVGPVGLERALAGGNAGGPMRLWMWDPEEMRPALYRIFDTGADTLRLGDGRVIPCRIFSVEDSGASRNAVRQWRDARGELWREIDPSIGVTTERSEVEGGGGVEAGSSAAPTAPRFDVARWALVPIVGSIPSRGSCTLILEPRAGTRAAAWGTVAAAADTSSPVPDGPGQSVVRGDRCGTWIVRLATTTAPPTSESHRTAWKRDPGLAGALRPGLLVDSDSPAIRAFADSIASGAGGSPTAEALLLETAVHDRIRLKDYSTVMGTASETLARGQGDCTEHAVLLAALCRARGIPARLVVGLTPQEEGEMAWHLWTEVWLDGWVALDATRGRRGLAPATVALLRTEHPEDDLGDLEGPLGVLSAGYRFRVLEGSE